MSISVMVIMSINPNEYRNPSQLSGKILSLFKGSVSYVTNYQIKEGLEKSLACPNGLILDVKVKNIESLLDESGHYDASKNNVVIPNYAVETEDEKINTGE